ncbi:uncharacterized protein LOC144144929 [Haemaphysalis longicornis]
MSLAAYMVAAMAFSGTFEKIYAGQSFPENNPALGIYQNEANCFPVTDRWYIMYRSFEYDPYFGGNPTCISVTQSGVYENSAADFSVELGATDKLNVTATLMSSPGYDVQNVLNVVAIGAPEVNFNLTVAYVNCESCKVIRHSYADGGKGCSLWQPKAALGQDVTCCHYVYDLVCGTSTKYQLYDNCA